MADNSFLSELRRAREARRPPPLTEEDSGSNSLVPKEEGVHSPGPPRKRPKEVIVLSSDEDEPPKHGSCDADAAFAARLQQEEYGGAGPSSMPDPAASDAAYAARLQQEEYSGGAGGGVGAPSAALAGGGSAPWPEELTWYEMQHAPGKCGNFDVCSQSGSSFFACVTRHGGREYRDSTAHGLEPRPLPGQTFTLKYLPHSETGDAECSLGLRQGKALLSRGGQRKARPGKDGGTRVVVARTPRYAPFAMPRFAGRVEPVVLGPRAGGGGHAERAFVLRDFDGEHGAGLAARLEAAFGLDVLDPPGGKGTSAKCAAAQGNNCQDTYTKLYPLRMFLEHRLELLEPLLDATLAAVNASLPSGDPKLDKRRGDRGAPSVGEAQILRFLSGGGGGGGGGSRMHVHVDKPGTRWVAICALGDTSTFLLDHAPGCRRCWTGGGAGTPGAKWADWHKVSCDSCREVTLRSGDCLLFYGDPAAGVAHGVLGTRKGSAPPGLPSWCQGGRVSCQFRQTEIRQNFAACGAYS